MLLRGRLVLHRTGSLPPSSKGAPTFNLHRGRPRPPVLPSASLFSLFVPCLFSFPFAFLNRCAFSGRLPLRALHVRPGSARHPLPSTRSCRSRAPLRQRARSRGMPSHNLNPLKTIGIGLSEIRLRVRSLSAKNLESCQRPPFRCACHTARAPVPPPRHAAPAAGSSASLPSAHRPLAHSLSPRLLLQPKAKGCLQDRQKKTGGLYP